jgi:predicted hydrocarbon binding protein
MTGNGRKIEVEQVELLEIKNIYESVMNLAANGLFFRAGQVIGKGISQKAIAKGGPYLKAISTVLVEEGWADKVDLDGEQVTVEGCIEVRPGADRSCNILRGILAEAYSRHTGTKLFCHEVECSGGGASKCVFKIRKGVV